MPNKFLPPTTTTVTRTAATPIDGEILYDTDEKKLYYGDGTTQGGKAIGSSTVSDSEFRIQDNSDPTKQIAFEASGITTGTTRTLAAPDSSGTIALIDTTGIADKDLFYYDASSKLFKRIAIGTTDQALIAKPSLSPPYQWGTVASSGRELLTANRIYYVRTDGSDSNNGLTNSSGGAFLTWQKAIDVYASLDQSIYDVTIKAGDTGTHAISSTLQIKKALGIGKLILEGATSTASNTILSGTMGANFLLSEGYCCLVNGQNINNVIIQNLQLNCNQNSIWSITLQLNNCVVDLKNLIFNQTGFDGNGYAIRIFSNSIVNGESLTWQGNVYSNIDARTNTRFVYKDTTTITSTATATVPINGDRVSLRFFDVTWSGTWSYNLVNYTHIVMKSGKTITGSATNSIVQVV